MKKVYLFLLTICVCVTNVYSQLLVDSTGHVGIGVMDGEDADSIMSPLSLLTAGSSDTEAYFANLNRCYTLKIENEQNGDSDGVGVYSACETDEGIGVGIYGVARSWGTSIGVKGITVDDSNSVGVYGGSPFYSLDRNFAGIYGSDYYSSVPYFQYSGVYAGYFGGTVRATGPMYAQAFYAPSATSSGNNNENRAVSLIGEGDSVTDKLRNVSSFELQHNEQSIQTRQSNPVEEFLKGRKFKDLTRQERLQFDSICSNIEPVKTDPLASVNYGLDAEQLKAVFPKLVQQDKEGNYSINYVEMVPLLVKGMNEMSAKIETLEQQLEVEKQAKRVKSETTGIENNVSDIDMVRMDQNKPNPFSESTVIGLNIPEKTQKANIFIYDLSGKQIQNVPVAERGETNITVYASDLGAGMYIYTLVIDGKVVVTRRMIVEK